MSNDAVFRPRLFDSFFAAGFECSSHRRRDRRRLDLIAATDHDRCVAQDYRPVRAHGMRRGPELKRQLVRTAVPPSRPSARWIRGRTSSMPSR
jgi:hypothetical protein